MKLNSISEEGIDIIIEIDGRFRGEEYTEAEREELRDQLRSGEMTAFQNDNVFSLIPKRLEGKFPNGLVINLPGSITLEGKQGD